MASNLLLTNNGHAGTAASQVAGTDTPAAVRMSAKRALPSDSESPVKLDMDVSITATSEFPDDPPEDVHPDMWGMLKSIHKQISRVNGIENRIGIIEEMLDNDGTQIAVVKDKLEKLESSNKVLVGRLLRAETDISRQQAEITDLRMRSMRDNIIIKTSGSKYQEKRDENTSDTVKKFLHDELRIPDAHTIGINSSHRMGQATGTYNKMLIARLPKREDHQRIFDNASALKGTNYTVSKQIPAEVDERRQFAWAEFKQAKAEKKSARFDGGTLVVGGDPVTKYQPICLPTFSTTLLGADSPPLPIGTSDVTIEADHRFRAWAVPARSADDVREGLGRLLQLPELAGATFVPYAYRFSDGRGSLENFHSDGDTSSGLSMVRILRERSTNNIAVYVAHYHALGRPLSRRKKTECLASVIGGAVTALTVAIGPRWMTYVTLLQAHRV